MQETTSITIITSTFNASAGFSRTAESIRSQTHSRIQWIVADGGSSDGTIELIKANGDIVDTWFSARDDGIYDAWNHALPYVRGEWVQFLGAGDELADCDALRNVAHHLSGAQPRFDIVYGRIMLVSEKTRLPLEEIGRPWAEMKGRWNGRKPMLPVHPEVFHHSSIFANGCVFDPRFRIAGDAHLLLRNVLKKDPLYVPVLVDRMPVGGVSDRISSAWKVSREIDLINRDLGIHPPLGPFLFDWLQVLAKIVLQRLLPAKALAKVGDRWRVLRGKAPRFAID